MWPMCVVTKRQKSHTTF